MRATRAGNPTTGVHGSAQGAGAVASAGPRIVAESEAARRHTVFRTIWIVTNVLLLFSLMAVVWTATWEYSTRRYLKGFSDAIIPFSAPPAQKVRAILDWMSHTPARIGQAPASFDDDRDPTDTLNYASLLGVCGTATNAFINLADSSGLTARRLLLLDANRTTVHVVAEVMVDGRWIVVDPTFHTIFRAADGSTLTREQLAVPAVFQAATQGIPGYDPAYAFVNTVHIRTAYFGWIGGVAREFLNGLFPNWEGSAALSLMVERESLGLTVIFILAGLLLLLVRTLLRWYGEARLGVHPQRIRGRIRRLGHILLEPGD